MVLVYNVKGFKYIYQYVDAAGNPKDYVWTYNEAAELINTIKPTLVIPTHYGEIVGYLSDADEFENMLN